MAPILAHTVSLPPVGRALQGVVALRSFAECDVSDAMSGARARGSAFVRVVQVVDDLSPIAWLLSQAHREGVAEKGLFYWATRDDSVQLAGLGCAASGDSMDGVDALEATDRMAPLEAVRRLVTRRFDPKAPMAKGWAPYGVASWYAPAIEVLTCEGTSAIAVQVSLESPNAEHHLQSRLREARETLADAKAANALHLPRFEVESESVGTAFWTQHIKTILRSISEGVIAKGVLARRSRWRATSPCTAADVVAVLQDAHPGTYRFLIQPPVDDKERATAFFGASPERLFGRTGQDLSTESLAGTRARGDDATGDDALENELLRSKKERYEHIVVTEQLRTHVESLCTAPPIEGPLCVRKLRHVQHLCTPLRGTLRVGTGDEDVLSALHPTPAVCGSPVPAARELIRSLEGFDRGLYAGPVGCIGADESEFAVAIRSGRMEGRRITLYAGAGIVEGSNADHEWKETESKLKTVEDLLRAEPLR